MDSRRFDGMTRTLAQGGTRRRLVKALLGGALAGAAVVRTTSPSVGACSRIFSDELPCSTDFQCDPGQFCDTRARFCCPTGTLYCQATCSCIPVGQWCATGSTCSPGFERCDGGCKNTSSDPGNCGHCGNRCKVGQICSNGRCCPRGQIACDGVCKPLDQCR